MSGKKDTYDNKKITKNYGLRSVDEAFKNWWSDVLNIHLSDKDGKMKKVPVFFVSSERWNKAREDGGIRDKQGTLVLPIIAILKPGLSSVDTGPFGRTFADTKQEHVIAKKLNPKSSLIKNLIKQNPDSLDPSSPIYEIYTAPVPDHYTITYEVVIWTSYMEEINQIIEKIGQQMDYKSQKSFQFYNNQGVYFTAFQDGDFENRTNLEDYTDDERLIMYSTTFTVSAHLYPQSDQRPDTFKRYFSQSKLVVNIEGELSEEEAEEIFGKKS